MRFLCKKSLKATPLGKYWTLLSSLSTNNSDNMTKPSIVSVIIKIPRANRVIGWPFPNKHCLQAILSCDIAMERPQYTA